MLFFCVIAIVFLSAYDYVYATTSYHLICFLFSDSQCSRVCDNYSYAQKDCAPFCNGAYGSQSVFCFLACQENSTRVEEYEECKQKCKGEALNEASCKVNCQLITKNEDMCDTVCGNDAGGDVDRCFFVCAAKNPTGEQCEAGKRSEESNCDYSGYDKCKPKCYELAGSSRN